MEDYDQPTPDEDVINAQLDSFIAAGDRTLTISGGEPTLLKKRLLNLVKRARDGGIEFIEVQTNAILIDADYAQQMREAGVTSAFVSLLSHVPELHDELAGLNGAFPKCIRGIRALIDADIRVALNPVTARSTQHLISDYVDFVARELSGVSSISLSAVQPHGRAQQNLELMPDYMELRRHVLRAQTAASNHGIELLNPYCGLPLCVGWSTAMAKSVEAIEAQAAHTAQGLQNRGNKRHGEACIDCGLRTRCGGAWHAYWDHRGGSGIQAPWVTPLPWTPVSDDRVAVIDGRASAEPLAGLPETPAVIQWLWVNTLSGVKFREVLAAGVSHIAVETSLDHLKPELARIRRWGQTNALLSPQRQVHFHLRLPATFNTISAQEASDLLRVFRAVGVTRAHLVEPGPHDQRLSDSGLA